METSTTLSVLVVEDDALIRESIKDAVEMEGFNVQTADHGGKALELLNGGFRPSLILLDLMMPVMNGWQLLNVLHLDKNFSDIPVIVLTAASGDVLGGLQAKGLIRKPFQLSQLVDSINQFCPRPAVSASVH